MRSIFITVLFFLSQFVTTAQVTTATMSGFVISKNGESIAGATVTLEFKEAGIKVELITKSTGGFVFSNLRVGGPYKISISHINFQESAFNDIYLQLGLNNSLEYILEPKEAQLLTNVVVQSNATIFDNKKTGASTNISSRQLRTMPTISRSADDFLRLTPSASSTYNGMSFAGRNGQYNNFSLDGAVFNNPFGLDAPTPGGQTNAQPVSLDAIDQIQINIAPYDVTQAGFTGAGINTVTKSGSNKSTGTIYGFFRNQSMTGKKVDGTKFTIPDLSQFQGGASMSGAIIKNKLYSLEIFECLFKLLFSHRL